MPRPSVIPHLLAGLELKQARRARHILSSKPPAISPRRGYPVARRRYVTTHTRSRLPPAPLTGSSEPHVDPPERRDTVHRSGRGYLYAVSISGALFGVYMVTLFLAEHRGRLLNEELDLEQNADVSERWRDHTRNFDREVENAESVMLMRAKRSRLVKEASGRVLEVSCGTGRNMDLYDLRPYDPKEDRKYGRSRKRIISSLTFNDQSEVMVNQATNKFLKMELARKEDERFKGDVTFIIGDARNPGVIDRPPAGYDTIVQTFGICSMAKPVEFLQRLGQLCRQPGEGAPATSGEEDEGGRILLLEHGRGHYDWINNLLDGKAKVHAKHYGCWWNKDIDQVIQDSGLRIERIKRYHAGTTWEVVLRPATTPSSKQA